MRVLLVTPLYSRNIHLSRLASEWTCEPLGVAYLAAVLRQNNHIPLVLDRRILLEKSNYDFEWVDSETISLIDNFKPDIIGYSCSTPQVEDVTFFSAIIRNKYPKIMQIMGGPHPTLSPDTTLIECNNIDIIVRGEGEFSLLELANEMPIQLIKGISYRNNNDIHHNLDREFISDLNVIPLPARDLLDMNYYLRPKSIDRYKDLRMMDINSSRGCYGNCTFCASPDIYNRKVRYFSAEYIIKEINDMLKYDPNFIYFSDDVFVVNTQRTTEVCNMFIESGISSKIKWVAQARADTKLNKEILLLMKKAGCIKIEFGFESGSQRILDLMKKNISVSIYKEIAKLMHEIQMDFQANIIFGYIDETEDDVLKTVEFLKEIKPASIGVNVLWALPGTKVYKELKARGYFLDKSMPMHPLLVEKNYTKMTDTKFKELAKVMLSLCPSNKDYIQSHREDLLALISSRSSLLKEIFEEGL